MRRGSCGVVGWRVLGFRRRVGGDGLLWRWPTARRPTNSPAKFDPRLTGASRRARVWSVPAKAVPKGGRQLSGSGQPYVLRRQELIFRKKIRTIAPRDFASWYGEGFSRPSDRQPARSSTCTGFSAAHPTLPMAVLRRAVTNLGNGRSLIVRGERPAGPYHADRLIGPVRQGRRACSTSMGDGNPRGCGSSTISRAPLEGSDDKRPAGDRCARASRRRRHRRSLLASSRPVSCRRSAARNRGRARRACRCRPDRPFCARKTPRARSEAAPPSSEVSAGPARPRKAETTAVQRAASAPTAWPPMVAEIPRNPSPRRGVCAGQRRHRAVGHDGDGGLY